LLKPPLPFRIRGEPHFGTHRRTPRPQPHRQIELSHKKIPALNSGGGSRSASNWLRGPFTANHGSRAIRVTANTDVGGATPLRAARKSAGAARVT